ncbi:MAG: hypothetical protein KatS3mg028_1633 [Bacteroidia bacterium]|nr:MAG: hypothetical protein KatS3mg028_1633 [Bacteroidia bacterium]
MVAYKYFKKKLLGNVFPLIIFSNLWVSANFVLWMIIYAGLNHLPAPVFEELFFVFIGVIFVYHMQRFTDKHKRYFLLSFLRQFKISMLIINLILLFILIYMLLFEIQWTQALILKLFFLGILAGAYVKFPFLKAGIRQLGTIKPFYIALVWTLAINWFVNEDLLNIEPVDFAIFLLISSYTIPFDIRDMQIDREKNFFTLPVLIGKYPALIIAILLMYASLGIFILLYPDYFIRFLILGVLFTGLYFLSVLVNNKFFYVSFILEALPVFFYVIVFCCH